MIMKLVHKILKKRRQFLQIVSVQYNLLVRALVCFYYLSGRNYIRSHTRRHRHCCWIGSRWHTSVTWRSLGCHLSFSLQRLLPCIKPITFISHRHTRDSFPRSVPPQQVSLTALFHFRPVFLIHTAAKVIPYNNVVNLSLLYASV